MGDKSAIEWTDATWNPWQGCHKVSPGCKFCYMYREKKQYGQDPAVVIRSKPHTFNLPLRLKAPARVFTCSWSDFFIEEADGWRLDAWDIIERTPHLTYQILTKRPERFRAGLPFWWWLQQKPPMPNVHLGVSVEDQATADERIPLLLQTPTAVRWISYEPALGPVDLRPFLWKIDDLAGDVRVDWVVIGGESGPGARPFDLAWARSAIAQCRAAGVPVFVKQLGAQPFYRIPEGTAGLGLRDRKGGSMEEWPDDLRVREFPK